jgi:hypothetical protein
MGHILWVEPVFKEMIWGGNQLKEKYGYAIPSDQTGECWAPSAHPNGDNTIKEGEFKGQTLSKVFTECLEEELKNRLKGRTPTGLNANNDINSTADTQAKIYAQMSVKTEKK